MTTEESKIEALRKAVQELTGRPVTYADAEKLAEIIKGEE